MYIFLFTNTAPQKVPAEQQYAEPYANTTAAKGIIDIIIITWEVHVW